MHEKKPYIHIALTSFCPLWSRFIPHFILLLLNNEPVERVLSEEEATGRTLKVTYIRSEVTVALFSSSSERETKQVH